MTYKFPKIQDDKRRFLAKTAMEFGKYLGTGGLATKLFVELSLSWRIGLAVTFCSLVGIGIALYPNKKSSQGRETGT